MSGNLPSFEEMRREAFKLLGDAADELRSDWRGLTPTPKQNNARIEALEHITRAKAALDRAATRE